MQTILITNKISNNTQSRDLREIEVGTYAIHLRTHKLEINTKRNFNLAATTVPTANISVDEKQKHSLLYRIR